VPHAVGGTLSLCRSPAETLRPRGSLYASLQSGAPVVAVALGALAGVVSWNLRQRPGRRPQPRTAMAESLSGIFQNFWIDLVRDEFKPPALRGNWSPVREESAGLPTEVVAGAIPDDFPAGHFVRNGPNPRWVRPSAGYHPFEGDGMLHSVEFLTPSGRRREARYSNRWVRTSKWLAEDAAQLPLASGIMDDSLPRIVGNAALDAASIVASVPALLNAGNMLAQGGGGVANTSVIAHAGRLLALYEGSQPVVMSLPHLETEGPLGIAGAVTAHPKVCPITGELIWFNYVGPGVEYGVWDRYGRPVHHTRIPLESSVMIHDMAVTATRSVIMNCPMLLGPDGMRKGEGPVWLDKEVPMRLGILPRHGSGDEVEWYDVPGPGKMCFHVMNAYDDPSSGEVVIVGCSMPDVTLWDMNVKFAHTERLMEWRIDTKTRSVKERTLSKVAFDFPRVNERFQGRPFRFGYGAAFDLSAQAGRRASVAGVGGPLFHALVKHDLQSGKTVTWEAGGETFLGEPVFVPRQGAGDTAEDEDDGYLLVHAHDEASRQSELLILDARAFGELPVCRIRMPRRVPYGFHAGWVSNDGH